LLEHLLRADGADQDLSTRANTNRDADCNSNGDTDCNTHCHADGHADRNTHGHTNSDADRNTHGHTNSDADRNTHGHTNGHTDRNTHGHTNGHTDALRHAHRDTDCDARAVSRAASELREEQGLLFEYLLGTDRTDEDLSGGTDAYADSDTHAHALDTRRRRHPAGKELSSSQLETRRAP